MAIQKKNEAKLDTAPTAAGSDLTGKEFYLVTKTSVGTLRLAQNGEKIVGVVQEGKAAGYYSTFGWGEILKVVASAAITVGQAVQAGADGTVIPGATNSFGVARNACFSGEMCEVMIDQV